MIIGERIKQARQNKGISRQKLATAICVGYSTLSNYEQGTREPNHEILTRLSKELGVTVDFLLGLSDNPNNTPPNIMPMHKFNKRIPILGTIACGEPVLAVQEDTEYLDIDELIDADFALYCKGDSMNEARIYDGDIVCIREQPRVENGEIAAVIIEESCEAEATLKKVYVKEDRIILRPCNVAYDDIVVPREEAYTVRILGKATYFISRVR